MGKTKTSPYDPAEYLRDDADMVAYLEVALADGDPRLVTVVLSQPVRRVGGKLNEQHLTVSSGVLGCPSLAR